MSQSTTAAVFDRGEPPPELGFRRLAAAEGLPSAEVRRLLQDSRGFIWMATNAGLVRYDAHEFRSYVNKPGDAGSLVGNAVWDLVELPDGRLCVATEAGLDLWDRSTERFERVPLPGDPSGTHPKVDVRTLLLTADGMLYVGTNRAGVLRLHPGRGEEARRVPIDKGEGEAVLTESVSTLSLDDTGQVWAGTRSGLLLCLNAGQDRFKAILSYPRTDVRDIERDRQGWLWVGTGDGLFQYNPSNSVQRYFPCDPTRPGTLSSPIIDDIHVDRQGKVWVGTNNGGLNLLNPATNTFHHYRHVRGEPRSLSSDAIRRVLEDRNGDLWISHFPEGVSYLNHLNLPFGIVRALRNDGRPGVDDFPWTFAEAADGSLWIGGDKGGLLRWDRARDRWTQFLHDPKDPGSLGSNTVACARFDRRGRLWAGTWNGGLNRLDPGETRFVRYLPNPAASQSVGSRHIKDLLEDSAGRFWVATDGDGINRLDTETGVFHHYLGAGEQAGIADARLVWCFYEAKDGSLWAGTNEGPALYDPEKDLWRRYVHPACPDSALWNLAVADIREHPDGSLWFGTLSAGLYRLERTSGLVRHYGLEDGLPGNSIRGLVNDAAGLLWVSTNKGLCRLDPSGGRIRFFDASNGLQGGQFARHSYLRLSSGELVFGGVEGFNIFDPSKVLDNTTLPRVALTELEVFNQPMRPGVPGSPLRQSLTETRSLAIPAALSVISFRFAALSYRAPERNRIQYKLEGFDLDWIEAGLEQRATYTNLDPGHYVLRVRAANNEGVWNEEGLSLELEIVPPFHRTWWFQSLLGLGLVAAIVTLSRAVSHRRLRERLREVEQERLLAFERQKAAEQQTKLEQQLMQAHKIESIGRLAGGVAHDLNNMLLPILGYSEMSLEELPQEHPLRENIEEIRRGALRSRDLVRQLLAFARKQPLAMKVVELNSVVEGLIPMLRRTLRENIMLKTALAPELPNVRGDVGQLEQVLLNLSVNAQDAMKNGGILFLQTSQVELRQEDVREGVALSPGHYVQLAVSDSGEGIPKAILPHVFEPFFTTKELGKGTGLGLSTVYGIVRQHGGEIRIYSEEGKGTVIRVYLPAVEDATQAEAAGTLSPRERKGSGLILLVEDVQEVRALTRRILVRAGYEVLDVGSACEALELERHEKRRIDLLVSDVVLPDINGRDLHRELEKCRPGLRVLYMSGYAAEVISHHGVLDEGVRLLTKPFSVGELLQMVDESLKE